MVEPVETIVEFSRWLSLSKPPSEIVDVGGARQAFAMAWMYILECADGSYYIGSTTSLDARIWEHQQGIGATYTRSRLPVALAYAEEHERIDLAFGREKQVQGWSRAKRRALIERRYADLPRLSASGGSTSTTV